jgi:hypothetical protein
MGSDQQKPSNRASKKPYSKPQLRVYGKAQELTGGNLAGSEAGMNKTH